MIRLLLLGLRRMGLGMGIRFIARLAIAIGLGCDLALLARPALAEEKRRAQAELKPGRVFRDCGECPEMVVVPAGSFTMGSAAREPGRTGAEGPQRRVTIGRPFAVGRYEVTFAEWDACVSAGGCSHAPHDGSVGFGPGFGRGKRPVINVSWDDTRQYVSWINGKVGKQVYRLLTEAEWEHAARAGTTTAYAFVTAPLLRSPSHHFGTVDAFTGPLRLPLSIPSA
jgi:formylglycine-generating enzyme required for sulfatase activity